MTDGIPFHLENFERNGDETVIRTMVFGPAVDEFVIAISVDPDSSELSVTIGNGPETYDVPLVVPDVLREVAGIIEDLGTSPEFWMSVGAHNATN